MIFKAFVSGPKTKQKSYSPFFSKIHQKKDRISSRICNYFLGGKKYRHAPKSKSLLLPIGINQPT